MTIRGWLTDLRLGLATERTARRAARPVSVDAATVRVTALGRYPLFAPVRDLDITPALMRNGRFDPWTGRLIARHVTPGMTVADVGANLGYFSLLLADRVGAQGHVHAFEPGGELCGFIARSVAANDFTDRMTLHEIGLGAEDGREMIFVTPGDHLAGSSVWEATRAHPSARPIKVRRLDRIPGADRIAFAKIDAEGSEPAIWAGMAGLLAGDTLRTIVMEFGSANYPDPAGFVGAIRAAGFAIERVDRRRGPVPIGDETLAALPADRIVNLLLRR